MLILPYTLAQQMAAFIEHKSMCRTAVSLGHDPLKCRATMTSVMRRS